MLLHEHCARGVARRVRVHDVRLGLVRQSQARSRGHCLLERVERLLLLRAPEESLLGRCPLRPALCLLERAAQLREWRRDPAETVDEASVVSRQADELLHLLLTGRHRPVLHCLYFVLHHAHAVSSDVVSEELHLRLEELALTAFGVQLMVAQALQHYL